MSTRSSTFRVEVKPASFGERFVGYDLAIALAPRRHRSADRGRNAREAFALGIRYIQAFVSAPLVAVVR